MVISTMSLKIVYKSEGRILKGCQYIYAILFSLSGFWTSRSQRKEKYSLAAQASNNRHLIYLHLTHRTVDLWSGILRDDVVTWRKTRKPGKKQSVLWLSDN